MSDIKQTLQKQSAEIAKEGINGWGNTMQDALTEIERLEGELADSKTNFKVANQACIRRKERYEKAETENKRLRSALEFYADAEKLAEHFHTNYEFLAVAHEYETKKESRTVWDKVPEDNKSLMIDTASAVGERARQALSQSEQTSKEKDSDS